MAEITTLMEDGSIPIVNANDELQQGGQPIGPDPGARISTLETDVTTILAAIAAELADGISLPQITATAAANGTIFWNTDVNEPCVKYLDGVVRRVRTAALP